MLVDNFTSKKCRESVIVVYATVEPTDGGSTDSDEI